MTNVYILASSHRDIKWDVKIHSMTAIHVTNRSGRKYAATRTRLLTLSDIYINL